MIAIDAKIIIRFLLNDDEQHFIKAYSVFNSENIFIADSVILEVAWVLQHSYKLDSPEIYNAFVKLFGLPNVHLSNPDFMAQTLEWFRRGLDFADAMHLSQCQQFDKLYSLDDEFIAKAEDLSACKVVKP